MKLNYLFRSEKLALLHSIRQAAISALMVLLAGSFLASSRAHSSTPILTSIAPNSANSGSPGITLVVAGSNFNRLSVLRWNGTDRVTTFLGTSSLTAVIPASDLAVARVSNVTVFNPPDPAGGGGGTSNALPFQVWNALPEGELFWTVRAVEMSGATRQPALMRRIQRVAGGVLIPTPATAGASFGNPTLLLQWKELKTPLASQPVNQPTNHSNALSPDCQPVMPKAEPSCATS